MIMAGGAGTRLWPMSRKDRPKQLIRFIQRDGKGVGKEPTCLLAVAAQARRVDPAWEWVHLHGGGVSRHRERGTAWVQG